MNGHYEALRERLDPDASRLAARIDAGLASRRRPPRTVSLCELVRLPASPSATRRRLPHRRLPLLSLGTEPTGRGALVTTIAER